MTHGKNLITIQDTKAVTTSLLVAQTFGKEHKNVLRDIQNLVAQNSAAKLYFTESQYENRGKWYPMYIINRDGFTLLAMGFTGKKALQFKIDYISAFNKMEEYIRNQQLINAEQLKQSAANEAVLVSKLCQIIEGHLRTIEHLALTVKKQSDTIGTQRQLIVNARKMLTSGNII